MYQDVYIEKSIRRQTSAVIKGLNLLWVIATAVVAFEFVFVDYVWFSIPLVVMILITYFVSQNAKLEFDYVYTNGILEITKIKRRRKRKDLLECEMKDVVVIAKSKTEPLQPYTGRSMTTFDCTSHLPEVTLYTMIVRHPKTGTETKVLFEPGDEMLEAMKRISPEKVYI